MITISYFGLFAYAVITALVLAFLYQRGNSKIKDNINEMTALIREADTLIVMCELIKEYAREHKGIQYLIVYELFDELSKKIR